MCESTFSEILYDPSNGLERFQVLIETYGLMTDIEAAILSGGINLFIPNDEGFLNPLNSNLTEMLTSSNKFFNSWIKCNPKFNSFRFILPW